MTQTEITEVINTHYSDKIQLVTLTDSTLNFLLFKSKEDGLKEFKGYSLQLSLVPWEYVNTPQDIQNIVDDVLSKNSTWYNG